MQGFCHPYAWAIRQVQVQQQQIGPVLDTCLDAGRRRMGDGNDFETLQPIQSFGEQLGNHGLVFNQDAAQKGLLGPREWQHRNRGQRASQANRPRPIWMLTES